MPLSALATTPASTPFDEACPDGTLVETSTVVTGQGTVHDKGHTHLVCAPGAETQDEDTVSVDVWKAPTHGTGPNCHRTIFVKVTVNGVSDTDSVRFGGCNKV